MKVRFFPSKPRRAGSPPRRRPISRRRAVLCLLSLNCAGVVGAQTNSPPAAGPGSGTGGAATNAPSAGSTNIVRLEPTTVVGRLDVAREQIVPDLGATVYTIPKSQIEAQPMGENASFNQVLLRAPGVAEDSLGQLHLRGEHANIQYRINDVLLPEGITGFGSELDPRFVESLRLITGSLPAEYGFRTAGVVDLKTKSGAFEPGGSASVYGGSYDTVHPSAEFGGSKGNLNYFVDASYNHNNFGLEPPQGTSNPIHDVTDQGKAFGYLAYIIDDTSRITAMASGSYANFQIPDTPGLQNNPANYTSPGGVTWNTYMPGVATFNSANENERQKEQNYYGVVAYQKSTDRFNAQFSAYGRYSGVHFSPDDVGDLFFDGVASDVDRKLYSGGVQFDASYELTSKHTLRGGFMLLDESVSADTTTLAFLMNSDNPLTWSPVGPASAIVNNSVTHSIFAGAYIQDEWKLVPDKLTLNYGARFDEFYSTFDKENQPSPRVNLIYQPTGETTLHAGYARYFTPPAPENVPSTAVKSFIGTSNEAYDGPNGPDSSAKAERANYYDVGASQKVLPGLQAGVDAYFKTAVNQLDDGFFGASFIPSNFNYAKGQIWGVEWTVSYNTGGLAAYANVAFSRAQGKDVASGQTLFYPYQLNYIQNNWIWLDHDQRLTGSFGASYAWKRASGATRLFADALYGSGLRQDGGLLTGQPGGPPIPSGAQIPNGAAVPSYYTVSLGGEETFSLGRKQQLKARLDVINITDNIYALRTGSGIGVNAAQYGMRLGFFGSLTYTF